MLLPSAASPVLDDVAKNVHGEPLRARRAGACRGRAQKPHRPVRASAERRRRLARCGGPLGRPVSAQCRPEKNEEQNPDGRDVEPGGVDVTDGETPLDDRRRRLRSSSLLRLEARWWPPSRGRESTAWRDRRPRLGSRGVAFSFFLLPAKALLYVRTRSVPGRPPCVARDNGGRHSLACKCVSVLPAALCSPDNLGAIGSPPGYPLSRV